MNFNFISFSLKPVEGPFDSTWFLQNKLKAGQQKTSLLWLVIRALYVGVVDCLFSWYLYPKTRRALPIAFHTNSLSISLRLKIVQ